MNDVQEPRRSRDEEALPTLQQVRRDHGLTSRTLADEAGVELRIEYLMEIGGVVNRADAQRVLQALSRLTHTHYTEHDLGGLCIRGPPSFNPSLPEQIRRRIPQQRLHCALSGRVVIAANQSNLGGRDAFLGISWPVS